MRSSLISDSCCIGGRIGERWTNGPAAQTKHAIPKGSEIESPACLVMPLHTFGERILGRKMAEDEENISPQASRPVLKL